MIGTLIARRNLRRSLRALEAHDLDTFLRNWSDDAVLVYPGDISASGTHAGREAIRRFFERWIEQFPDARFTVHDVALARCLDFTGTNTAALISRFDATNQDGRAVSTELVTTIRLVRGKAVHVQDYFFETGDTMRSAWGEPGGAAAGG